MPANAVLVAIDFAKHRNEVLIEAPGAKRCRRLTLLNVRAGQNRLIESLSGYDLPVVIGFEATGDCHRRLA